MEIRNDFVVKLFCLPLGFGRFNVKKSVSVETDRFQRDLRYHIQTGLQNKLHLRGVRCTCEMSVNLNDICKFFTKLQEFFIQQYRIPILNSPAWIIQQIPIPNSHLQFPYLIPIFNSQLDFTIFNSQFDIPTIINYISAPILWQNPINMFKCARPTKHSKIVVKRWIQIWIPVKILESLHQFSVEPRKVKIFKKRGNSKLCEKMLNTVFSGCRSDSYFCLTNFEAFIYENPPKNFWKSHL